MSRPIPPTYKSRNWPAYNEAPKRRGSMTIWFDPAMTWEAARTGKRGRQPDWSDSAIQTCLTMKVLYGIDACYQIRPMTRVTPLQHARARGFDAIVSILRDG